MANPACEGIWLNNKLDQADDGNFVVFDFLFSQVGLHYKGSIGSRLRDLSCHGNTIGFKRTDPAGNEIEYIEPSVV